METWDIFIIVRIIIIIIVIAAVVIIIINYHNSVIIIIIIIIFIAIIRIIINVDTFIIVVVIIIIIIIICIKDVESDERSSHYAIKKQCLLHSRIFHFQVNGASSLHICIITNFLHIAFFEYVSLFMLKLSIGNLLFREVCSCTFVSILMK